MPPTVDPSPIHKAETPVPTGAPEARVGVLANTKSTVNDPVMFNVPPPDVVLSVKVVMVGAVFT